MSFVQGMRDASRVVTWTLYVTAALHCGDYLALKALSVPMGASNITGNASGLLPLSMVESLRASIRDMAVLRLARRYRSPPTDGVDSVGPASSDVVGGGVVGTSGAVSSAPVSGAGAAIAPGSATPGATTPDPRPAILTALQAPFLTPVCTAENALDTSLRAVCAVEGTLTGPVVGVSIGLVPGAVRTSSADAAANAAVTATDAWLTSLTQVCMRYLVSTGTSNLIARLTAALPALPGDALAVEAVTRKLLHDLNTAADAWRKDEFVALNHHQPPPETWTLLRATDNAYCTQLVSFSVS